MRNIDDVADLLKAAVCVPPATLRRYERIAGWLFKMHRGSVAVAFQIRRFLSMLALDTDGPDAGFVRPFEALAARIPHLPIAYGTQIGNGLSPLLAP